MPDLAIVLSLISTAAVVFGLVFAGFELRHLRRQRAREAALVLARSYQTPEFMRALDRIVELPDGLNIERLEARGPETMEIVGYWLGSIESIAYLVHSGELELSLVEDFMSGPIVISWRKLHGYVEERRKRLGRATMHEWFQWLAERIEERELARAPIPANIEYGQRPEP